MRHPLPLHTTPTAAAACWITVAGLGPEQVVAQLRGARLRGAKLVVQQRAAAPQQHSDERRSWQEHAPSAETKDLVVVVGLWLVVLVQTTALLLFAWCAAAAANDRHTTGRTSCSQQYRGFRCQPYWRWC